MKLITGYDIKLEKKSLEDFNEECLWGHGRRRRGGRNQSESDTDIALHFYVPMEEKGHAFTRSKVRCFGLTLTTGFIYRPSSASCVHERLSRLPADRRGKTEEQNKWVKQIESIVNDDPEFRNKVVHTTYRKIAFKNGITTGTRRLV